MEDLRDDLKNLPADLALSMYIVVFTLSSIVVVGSLLIMLISDLSCKYFLGFGLSALVLSVTGIVVIDIAFRKKRLIYKIEHDLKVLYTNVKNLSKN